MSKLFRMKEWLTVPDTARHLSIVFGEDVTEADVLRLALDGKLTLSVNFVNGGHARPGSLVPIAEATYEEIQMPKSTNLLRIYGGGPKIMTDGVQSHVLHLEDYVARVEGVHDLPMIGGERIEVENRYQQLTGGPAATNVPMDGAFIGSFDGRLCQLQDDFDDNEYTAGSSASLQHIKRHIATGKIGKSAAEELLKQHAERRKTFLEDRKSKPQTEQFYAGGDLPDDVVFVVRTEALNDFTQRVNVEPSNVEKPLGTTERNTLLTIIAALAKEAKLNIDQPGKAAISIEDLTDKLGTHVSKRAIEDHLKKIPNALETRMK